MNNLTAIAAMAANRVIGHAGAIPWYLPEDMRFFRRQTLGHTIIMGRKTWEGLRCPPLPRRRNIVLSRTLADVPGGEILRSPDGLDRLTGVDRVFVIGGEQIYRLLLPQTTEILLTVLEEEAEGDAVFPEFEGEFGEPEILDRLEGVCEWRRYVRIQPPSPSLTETNRRLAAMPPARITAEDARRQVEEHRDEALTEIQKS